MHQGMDGEWIYGYGYRNVDVSVREIGTSERCGWMGWDGDVYVCECECNYANGLTNRGCDTPTPLGGTTGTERECECRVLVV
jgi:hypothetical protein